MKTVTINQFDGGIAEDLRTHSSNECADSINFDIFSNPHKLIHLRDMIREPDGSDTINHTKISDVGTTTLSGTNYMVAFGETSVSDNRPTAYYRSIDQLNATSNAWASQAVGVASYRYVSGSYIQYNGVSYCLGQGQSSTLYVNLQKYTGGGSLTAIDTVVYSPPAGITTAMSIPKPFVHPTDNRMYIANGNSLAQWDGVSGSFTDVNSLLPAGFEVRGITNWGDYLAIAMSPVSFTDESIICLWDRDSTNHATYLNSIIKCGNERIDAFDNLDGNLVIVTSPGNNSFVTGQKLKIKIYSGGQMQTVKSYIDLTTYSNNMLYWAKKNNRLYFARYNDTAVWCVGKNKQGRYVVTHEYLVYKGSTATSDKVSSIYGLSFVGDCLYVGYIGQDSTFRLTETSFGGSDGTIGSSSVSYVNPAIYTTSINPSMPIEDRDITKKLMSIQVLFDNSTYGNCTLEYAINGTNTFNTIFVKDMSDGKNIIEASTQNGVPFLDGREYQFRVTSTWGANIIGIKYKYQTLPQLV